MISLETDRLTIRNFHPDDWQDLQEMAIQYQASEWAKYEDPWPTSAEEVKGMAQWFAGGDEYLAACLKTTGKLIGLVAINRRGEQEGQIRNLGYVFHPGYYGQGYATEGCQAAMGYVFGPLAADGILTGTHPANEPSVKLLKRLGLTEVRRGEFALSRAEWLADVLIRRLNEKREEIMKKLEGLKWHPRYNEHMGCTKGCLDYLGIDVSFPWLYGGTGNAFVLNMNDTAFVDAAQAWDISMLFDLAPNLGYTVERFTVEHEAALAMPGDVFLQKQREAYDSVQARIDQGLPCYAWELTGIPAYYVITGYDDTGYTYSGWDSDKRDTCPWDKLGAFDVKMLAVNCVRPAAPAPDRKTVRDALATVLARVERPDGWAVSARYRTGLPAYEMWAEALETGHANLDGEAYLNVVWRECREMASDVPIRVEFLQEAKTRLLGPCDGAFDDAIEHYVVVRDKLRALAELYPERPDRWDWQTTFACPEGAQLVREAGEAERQGVAGLKRIVPNLST